MNIVWAVLALLACAGATSILYAHQDRPEIDLVDERVPSDVYKAACRQHRLSALAITDRFDAITVTASMQFLQDQTQRFRGWTGEGMSVTVDGRVEWWVNGGGGSHVILCAHRH